MTGRRAAPHAGPCPVFINGRYLGRPVTGVERFANGIVGEIDRRLSPGDAERFTILAPEGVERPIWLQRIGFRTVGRRQGHAWEQSDLWRASRGGVLVSLCNSGPVLHPRHLAVLHDALVYRHPENFSRAYRGLHRVLGRLLARRAHLATVSAFSRRELSGLLGVPEARIGLVPNAVDHMAAIVPDRTVVERLSLDGRPFFLFVGSPAVNKNLGNAIRAFAALERPEASLVLVGSAAGAFARSLLGKMPGNVVATGRLSDEEVKALYEAAAALVFPSIYEGFGIPPLEAMSVGCPVIASDIEVLREVCGGAASYFDPHDPARIAQAMRDVLDARIDGSALREAGLAHVRNFSWERSAGNVLALVEKIGSGNQGAYGRTRS